MLQSWYADDSNAAGRLRALKRWWDTLNELGPKYGYFPKPIKTVLLVKDRSLEKPAKDLFKNSGVQIRFDGHKHLGAAIGTEEFNDNYIKNKIEKWVEDVKELASIAIEILKCPSPPTLKASLIAGFMSGTQYQA